MKIKLIILLVIGAMAFSGCDKETEMVADFSNSMPIYVELSSTAGVAAKEGVNTNVQVRLRETIQQPVTVNYEITGAGAKTGSVTIPKGTTTANIVLNFPVGTVPAASTTATAKITLKSATAGTENLTIGYAGTNQISRNITISK